VSAAWLDLTRVPVTIRCVRHDTVIHRGPLESAHTDEGVTFAVLARCPHGGESCLRTWQLLVETAS
jgi:hypothetical protein